MKIIIASRGEKIKVDDADYEWLSVFQWYTFKPHLIRYACRYSGWDKVKDQALKATMHREIMCARIGELVDHRDMDGLNNCRSNLRLCTYQENNRNRPPSLASVSGYKGVCWHSAAKKWMAQIKTNTGNIYLGLFTNIHEAAEVYNEAAKKYFGEFAWLNTIKE